METDMNSEDDALIYRDSFALPSLPQQEAVLVPRQFAVEYNHDLSLEWKLIDPIGKAHLVTYGKNLEFPYVCNGLVEIRNYYSLEGLNWFLLKYNGLSKFELFIFNEKIEEVHYLPYFPRTCDLPALPPLDISPPPGSVSNGIDSKVNCTPKNSPQQPMWICYPCFFTCKLSPNQVNSSQLNLPSHVYEYLLNEKVFKWTLRGPTGMKSECTIVGVPSKSYARFGRGWKTFCSTHGLKAGDVLTFYFTTEKFVVIDVVVNVKPEYNDLYVVPLTAGLS